MGKGNWKHGLTLHMVYKNNNTDSETERMARLDRYMTCIRRNVHVKRSLLVYSRPDNPKKFKLFGVNLRK